MDHTIVIEITFGKNDTMMDRFDVAAALKDLAVRIEEGQDPSVIMDINGNRCGTIRNKADVQREQDVHWG